MKSLIILALILLNASCGRNNSGNDCRTREHMIVDCIPQHQHNYGHPYAQKICSEKYTLDRCY
jgi:hypothetical protein